MYVPTLTGLVAMMTRVIDGVPSSHVMLQKDWAIRREKYCCASVKGQQKAKILAKTGQGCT